MARYKLLPGKSIKWGDFEATALDAETVSLTLVDTPMALSAVQVSHLIEVLTGVTEWDSRHED